MVRRATRDELERPAAPFNLEHFLKNLTLEPMVHSRRAPPMPEPKARSTMTPLTMKPGGYRKLKEVKRMDCLETEATFFFNDLNDQFDDGSEFTALSLFSQVPTETMVESLMFNPYEVNDRIDVMIALESGPFMSVQTLVHTIDEELRQQDWKFHVPRRNGTLNNQGMEPVFFTRLDQSQGMKSVNCIVVPLTPWEFTPQDFEDFTCMSHFVDGNKSTNGEDNCPPWKNADKLWGYLHDQCLIHDCRHFVVTTYEQWSFGGFSPYLATSFVSEVKSRDSKPNSIIEMFTYWIFAACSFDNTVMLHEAPREQNVDRDLFEKERQLQRKRLLDDGVTTTGPESTIQEVRPAKRARMDHIEDVAGWQAVAEHISAAFPSPRKGQMHAWNVAGKHRRGDRPKFALVKPSERWNDWRKRRAREEKENSFSAQNPEVRVHAQPPVPSDQENEHHIPCYSMDVDRVDIHENDCFGQELIALRYFPKPTP